MRASSINTNCLEGYKCPKCGQENEILVEARMWVSLTDDGTDPFADSTDNLGGTEYDDDSLAFCPGCGYGQGDATVKLGDFRKEQA